MTNLQAQQPGEFLLYETEDGRTRVECRFVDDTLWLSQAGMAELFQTTPQNITLHLKGLYAEGEIISEATCKDGLQVRSEGGRQVRRLVKFYNLDAILAVGYRVRSPRGTQFRRWATERLREYLVKGFTLDDERLKNPSVAGSAVPDRFDELLARGQHHVGPAQRAFADEVALVLADRPSESDIIRCHGAVGILADDDETFLRA